MDVSYIKDAFNNSILLWNEKVAQPFLNMEKRNRVIAAIAIGIFTILATVYIAFRLRSTKEIPEKINLRINPNLKVIDEQKADWFDTIKPKRKGEQAVEGEEEHLYFKLYGKARFEGYSEGLVFKKGRFYFCDGKEYNIDGDFTFNEEGLSGTGFIEIGSGIFHGTFENGKPKGEGQMTLRDCTLQKGEMDDSFKLCGHGRIETDSKVYEGQFDSNRLHGKGTIIDKDGNIIAEGEFVNGVLQKSLLS